MQDIQPIEHYTDKGKLAAMRRTRVVKDAQLFRIAGHLCRNAEDLVASTNPPTVDNCRIAGAMLHLAYNLVPLHIALKFDY